MVNADDPHAELLGRSTSTRRRVSLRPRAARRGRRPARIERLDRSGSRFLLRGFDREAAVELRLIGPRQRLAGPGRRRAVAWARRSTLDAVVAGLEAVADVPGRLEAVDEGQDFDVRIDQARDRGRASAGARRPPRPCPPAGSTASSAPRGSSDRARAARALAEAAEAGADRVILTTDNPRTEDPDQILDDLLAGFRRPGTVRVEPDRRRAIEAALADARPATPS